MAKTRTPEEFSGSITSDFTWRLQELSTLKLAVKNANAASRGAFARSLVVMCYAHWEGHAKYCAERLLSFLTVRRLKFNELNERYYQVRFLKEISSSNMLPYRDRLTLVGRILSSKEERFSRFPKELIDTKSNLNSEVLVELCLVCNLDHDEFAPDLDFIDRILLSRRNEVAHGEAVFIDAVDEEELVDRTLRLMRNFRDQVENQVVLKSYLSELPV